MNSHLSCLHGANIRGISRAAKTAIQTCRRAVFMHILRLDHRLEKKGGKFELLDATNHKVV